MKNTSSLFAKLVISVGLFGSVLVAEAQIATDITVFRGNERSRIGNPMMEEYQRVGTYKVKGNSFVLKGANVSDIYTRIGFGANMPIVYDANTQNVHIVQEDPTKVIKLKMDELDSFLVKKDNDGRFASPVLFVNASRIDKSKKFYAERLNDGPKYSLYKQYSVELRQATMDVAQTDVREFEIVAVYYFVDKSGITGTGFIKIKNEKSLKESFEKNTAAWAQFPADDTKTLEQKLLLFFSNINH